jgi:PKD repeat protein
VVTRVTLVREQMGGNDGTYQVCIMMKRNILLLSLLCILVMAVLAVPVSAGINVTSGEKIISPYGTTSTAITIEGDALQDSTITIDVINLYLFVYSGTFNDLNIEVSTNATAATWSGAVSGDGGVDQVITLSSTGTTYAGESIFVNFTGAKGNPWLPGSTDIYGEPFMPLYVTRNDNGETADPPIIFWFETPSIPPGGLTITDGEKITTAEGVSSPKIMIEGDNIPDGGTIIVSVPDLYMFTEIGTFTNANIEVSTDAAATWSGVVSGTDGVDRKITLTSTGVTLAGESVRLNFTGANGNPWLADSYTLYNDVELPLTVTRMDTFQIADPPLYFKINTTPPPPPVDLALYPDFTASPREEIAPAEISFTDISRGNPTIWAWDFGDGGTSTEQNPDHTYTNPGLYQVTLSIESVNGMGLVAKTDYINIFNGVLIEADTSIPGLTITNCGGPQTITVNTSIITHYALSPGKSVLEIQAPPGSGFKNITVYALNGIGFIQDGDLITGDPTGVHLVSEEIAPSSGFSNEIGTSASFYYSIDLSSYPCNGKVSTKIWEGTTSSYDNKLRQIADNNSAGVAGTAYTVEITKTNFPLNAKAKIYMSVNSSWQSSLRDPTGILFIWRIADDGKSGQVLHTNKLYTDPVNNIDYYEADSPLGLSTFGISSLTGNNNPFQVIAFVAATVINQPGNPSSPSPAVVQPAIAAEIQQVPLPDPGTNTEIPKAATPEPTILVASKSPMQTNVEMYGWLIAFIIDNPVTIVIVLAALALVAYFGWWKRRL